ncbi:MAG TPA: NADP-dependent oxidoreductase [Cellulomonas sp.]|uniref:quinone oxidoreductase family protein n=1 Tax=Cellulomonas sp. TaxID=40001 RepID=UPI002E319235|nr:NADP-dependent oxidoreductase [Cellulomonas sp.]HEX5331986.1 NADP-dependent oxidoreductase [Cellulomonas sp.]
MSRAVVATAYGGPEVLSVVDVAVPEPGPGEVLLDVRAAGVNPIDWKLYSGAFGTDPARLPIRLGLEVAGVVMAVGPGVEDIPVGDHVIATGVHGGYAEMVLVPAARLEPKPARISWAEAAGLLLTGSAAWHTLEATGAGAGDVVLVHGASGSVGRFVVQLARLRGAQVVATASEATHADLRALGAVPVTYGPGLADRVREATGALGPVTVAIDTVGTEEALDVSVELVADRSRIATIAGFGHAGGLGIQLLGNGPGADPGTSIRAAAIPHLVELAADRELLVAVAHTYPLEEVAQAHRDSIAGHARGKLVLLP